MEGKINPALAAFLDSFTGDRVWAQVRVRRMDGGFELRHVADGDVEGLRAIGLEEARKLAIYNSAGQFRPLKSAPDLQRGWRLACRDEQELWRAIQEFYPGSLPDAFAVQNGTAVVTDYRAFTNRQTGMYRITQLHSDEQAADVISACCPPQLCLKRRFWTVNGLAPDAPETKSGIPCLEPCAVLLELARKAARIEQEEKVAVSLAPSDLETIAAALQQAREHPAADGRTGDIGSPLNPRRIQLVIEKQRKLVASPVTSASH